MTADNPLLPGARVWIDGYGSVCTIIRHSVTQGAYFVQLPYSGEREWYVESRVSEAPQAAVDTQDAELRSDSESR